MHHRTHEWVVRWFIFANCKWLVFSHVEPCKMMSNTQHPGVMPVMLVTYSVDVAHKTGCPLCWKKPRNRLQQSRPDLDVTHWRIKIARYQDCIALSEFMMESFCSLLVCHAQSRSVLVCESHVDFCLIDDNYDMSMTIKSLRLRA